MVVVDALQRGRRAVERRAWAEAHAQFEIAGSVTPLSVDDLERHAWAAYLAGHDVRSSELMARLCHERQQRGELQRAANVAFWLGMGLFDRGEQAQAGGWFARARGLVEKCEACAEHGLLMIPAALQSMYGGDAETSYAAFTEAAAIGDRFGNPDLMTLGRLGRGQSLILLDDITRGMSLLDEAMVAVTADEVSPVVAGIVYCAVIEACNLVFDLPRAQEWTAALGHWCDAQPELVPFRGNCLVHRSEILLLRGSWTEAATEAERACDRLSRPSVQAAIAAAMYQRAQVHRLLGKFDQAEAGYQDAARGGHDAQPGWALLRLAQRKVEAARAAIQRAIVDPARHAALPRLLAAATEIALAAGDVPGARAVADQLAEIAGARSATFLDALAAHAVGAVLLAEGDARAASSELRRAWSLWQEMRIPYEAAKTRVLMGSACRDVGDDDGAQVAFGAARRTFEHLGAAPDMLRLDALTRRPRASSVGGLSQREVEVLRLVASGKTNRTIAAELFLSEKTVARHLSNIFVKLGVMSRSAATAFAYEHDVVHGPDEQQR